MKISKSSWHYRLIRKLKGEYWVEKNLCGYFWQVVACFIGIAVLAFFAALLLAFAVAPLVALADAFNSFLPDNIYKGGGFLPLVIGGSIGYFFGTVYLIERLWKKYKRAKFLNHMYEPYVEPTPKEPGILRVYIKSLRDKTCVPLEFVDSTEVK